MRKKKNQDSLTQNLIRLLRRLEFSDLRVKNHAEFPDPYTIQQETNEKSCYKPRLSAYKHGVIYHFEVIHNNLLDSQRINGSLQQITELDNMKWNLDLVLVTNYGNKEMVLELCQNHNLPALPIWEL